MKRFLALLPALAASCALYQPAPGGLEGRMPDPEGAPAASFPGLADAALEALYAAYPDRATRDGLHDHDSRLGDWSRADVDARVASFRRHLARLEAVPLDALPEASRFDALLLQSRLRAELLELETVRGWERNPGHYRAVISRGLDTLAGFAFDRLERRRALAESRLRDVPRLLAAARENLAEPPRLFTELAIADFDGLLSFLRDGLAPAFGDPKTPEFLEARKAAVEAVASFLAWMKSELLPRSTGSFALGAETYRAKLLYEEMVDTPPDILLDRGYDLLRGIRAAMAGLGPADASRPSEGKLLEEARRLTEELRGWAATELTLPEGAGPLVIETPPFRRSTSFASLQMPGPFETEAKEAYYAITLPERDWTDDRKEQHLSFFGGPSLALITAHETWPGHYAQGLLAREAPTRVRKALGSAAFSEGWAHYVEELYAEAGPPARRRAQLQMALLRACRYVAALEMHTRGMSVEKATAFFMQEGLLPAAAAEREAKRGAVDPLYLVYTLGKAEILRLRDDWCAATGRPRKEFHDALLRLGRPPLKLARSMLLGG